MTLEAKDPSGKVIQWDNHPVSWHGHNQHER
jgi:hypothetical protein